MFVYLPVVGAMWVFVYLPVEVAVCTGVCLFTCSGGV